MSDHRDVREALQAAAVEPGGLDRLEAGDTAEAALVVGHLAGCPECLEEMARLRRADTLLRPILASEPDPALRERTLAFVRELGVRRDVTAATRDAAVPPGPGRRPFVGGQGPGGPPVSRRRSSSACSAARSSSGSRRRTATRIRRSPSTRSRARRPCSSPRVTRAKWC